MTDFYLKIKFLNTLLEAFSLIKTHQFEHSYLR